MQNKLAWWAYKLINGKVQVRQYFPESDLEGTAKSASVTGVLGPATFTTKAQAEKHYRRAFVHYD